MAAARDRVSRNMGTHIRRHRAGGRRMLADHAEFRAPVGCRKVFAGPFGTYFTLMLPAMLCFALANYAVGPAFQIAHRTMPLVIGGLVATLANGLAILLLPTSRDASVFALAQSISSGAALAAMVAFLFSLEPMWPRGRDVGGTIAATGLMLAGRRAIAVHDAGSRDAGGRDLRRRLRLCFRRLHLRCRAFAQRADPGARGLAGGAFGGRSRG